MAKKVTKSTKTNQLGWQWIFGGLVLLGVVVWAMNGKNMNTPVGINEVSESASILQKWEFNQAADMGKATGWYVTKPIGGVNSLRSMTPQQIKNSTVVATTLVDGFMVLPGSVTRDNSFINESVNIALPDANQDLIIKVVAKGTVVTPPNPSTPSNVQLPDLDVKGRLQLGKGARGEGNTNSTSKPVVSGSDMVYSFKINAQELKKMKSFGQLPIRYMSFSLVNAGKASIENVKIDSIEINLVNAPVQASPTPTTTTVSGNLHVSGRGSELKCVITTASKVDYQIIYTGPAGSPTASPVKGCPPALADFVRKDVTVMGTLIQNTNLLRIASTNDITINN